MIPSLFDRLAHGVSASSGDEDESIRMHLLRMLTTRQGSVQSLPGYGLPDLNDVNLTKSEILHLSSRAIEECINAYEPRLEGVRVAAASKRNNSLALQFSISAMKRDEKGNLSPWSWKVEMYGDKVTNSGS